MAVITRILVALYGALFAIMGLGFWVAPDRLADRLSVEAVGVAGLSTLRGDFGGAFLILAALCLIGLWRRSPTLLTVGAALLSLIVTGRLLTWAITGDPAGVVPNVVIEVIGAVALGLHARAVSDGSAARRPLRAVAVSVLVLGLVVVAAGAAFNNAGIQDRLLATFARQGIARDTSALMKDDALRVAICGTSAPLPSLKRAKSCIAVIAGGKIYIVDVGPESVENLMLWGIPLGQVDGVLLTHFHSDHIGDLGELNLQTWVQGRPGPLAVYGGPGVERVVAGFNEAYALDQTYRTAHHTAKLMPAETWPLAARSVAMPQGVAAPSAVVLEKDGLRITAIETNHAPVHPAYAYRFDYKGRSVVITGDTTADPRLTAASRGADILLSEALNREMIETLEAQARGAGRDRVAHIMDDIQSYHISPTEAAEAANEANVRLLALYHLLPAPDNPLLKAIFRRGLNETRKGAWHIADDGTLYTLPLNATDVDIGRIP
ncbi:MAG: MBL fold metallo-hydrolase [Phenylobacterium sp.]|nr:MBL fold metallo-hydrolase [Phenylobacterium sp.]